MRDHSPLIEPRNLPDTERPKAPTGPATTVDRTILLRRIIFGGLVGGTILAMIVAMVRSLSPGGFGALDLLMVALFAVTLPWTAIGFWNAVIGLWLMRTRADPAAAVFPALADADDSTPITASTALLSCIRNEDAGPVFGKLARMIDELDKAGTADRFHVYVLSDSTFSDVIRDEEARFAALKSRYGSRMALTYRRRTDNYGFKAGNIRDFCERWGKDHDFMLTLDADSFITAPAILRLVRLMQTRPELGIIQSLVVGLPSASAFTRVFQFGMRLGMRSYTTGSAWWQGDCGPYWGHNAIIRLAPFMESCHLPVLPGTSPLSGVVLSHDQVEAVLMRRAGYEVRVIAEDGESYEENPPNLNEFIRRDLRWCHGNMQYFKLLNLPDVRLISRMQLVLAILMFIGAPAWLGFMALATSRFIAVDDPLSVIDPAMGLMVFASIMTMVFAPKFATIIDILADGRRRHDFGGGLAILLSALLELVFAALIAPIMAVAQTVFLAGLPFGRANPWPAQRRDVHGLPVRFAARRLWAPTLFGAVGLAVLGMASSGFALVAA
ncbi:MAG: glucans biosynthesis glucosyltransferase MdoH, partial [Pseudomonadota bacterium]